MQSVKKFKTVKSHRKIHEVFIKLYFTRFGRVGEVMAGITLQGRRLCPTPVAVYQLVLRAQVSVFRVFKCVEK